MKIKKLKTKIKINNQLKKNHSLSRVFNISKHKKKKFFISKIKKEKVFIIKRFNNNDIIFERFKRAKGNY